jgi:NADPH:quinone reductase-like Zn-dependent oxidoreductase
MAEVKKSSPNADQVLVKVLAVSVNPADWRSMHAKPFFFRHLGLLRPKHRIRGGDLAGQVVGAPDLAGRGTRSQIWEPCSPCELIPSVLDPI